MTAPNDVPNASDADVRAMATLYRREMTRTGDFVPAMRAVLAADRAALRAQRAADAAEIERLRAALRRALADMHDHLPSETDIESSIYRVVTGRVRAALAPAATEAPL